MYPAPHPHDGKVKDQTMMGQEEGHLTTVVPHFFSSKYCLGFSPPMPISCSSLSLPPMYSPWPPKSFSPSRKGREKHERRGGGGGGQKVAAVAARPTAQRREGEKKKLFLGGGGRKRGKKFKPGGEEKGRSPPLPVDSSRPVPAMGVHCDHHFLKISSKTYG